MTRQKSTKTTKFNFLNYELPHEARAGDCQHYYTRGSEQAANKINLLIKEVARTLVLRAGHQVHPNEIILRRR